MGIAGRDIASEFVDQAQERRFRPKAIGGGKNYNAHECVMFDGKQEGTPQTAMKEVGSAPSRQTTRNPGDARSRRAR